VGKPNHGFCGAARDLGVRVATPLKVWHPPYCAAWEKDNKAVELLALLCASGVVPRHTATNQLILSLQK
jgi:hypothetical protein